MYTVIRWHDTRNRDATSYYELPNRPSWNLTAKYIYLNINLNYLESAGFTITTNKPTEKVILNTSINFGESVHSI